MSHDNHYVLKISESGNSEKKKFKTELSFLVIFLGKRDAEGCINKDERVSNGNWKDTIF